VLSATDDLRIAQLRPLLPPAILMEELPLSESGSAFVAASRKAIGEIVAGRNDRLLVVVGPCSIHDPAPALEYAERLAEAAPRWQDALVVVMRTYFEKPRTTVGWKGLINDPHLDNSFAINTGLRVARRLLCDIVELGLPPGTEFLDPISPQFIADLVCWGAIGARTVESQVHRELASGLSMPVGFKNGTGGSIAIAVDAIRASVHPHHFLSVTKQGLAAIVETRGNDHTHLILRGGGGLPNYDAASVERAVSELAAAGVNPHVMIDASHANSGKDPRRQPLVAEDVAAQVARGQEHIVGVMLESFLREGNQKVGPKSSLEYGKSVTDACLGWDATLPVLDRLAEAVCQRRAARG
jgi:3-deoxy-7-phosphoheptulonate synthase